MRTEAVKKELQKNGWEQLTVRLRSDYFQLFPYFDFLAHKEGVHPHFFTNDLFNYSLKNLLENGFHYEMDIYKPLRKPKGILLHPDTITDFNNTFEWLSKVFMTKYNRKLLVAEFTELLLYIYIINNLDQSDLDKFDTDFGIHVKNK